MERPGVHPTLTETTIDGFPQWQGRTAECNTVRAERAWLTTHPNAASVRFLISTAWPNEVSGRGNDKKEQGGQGGVATAIAGASHSAAITWNGGSKHRAVAAIRFGSAGVRDYGHRMLRGYL